MPGRTSGMKTILCYGDSNTYGYNPTNFMRYDSHTRWTCVMRDILNSDGHREQNGKAVPEYNVIEEGQNGRTTIYDDPLQGFVNGKDYLKPCLAKHKPVDIVILMIGSNDLKDSFHAGLEQIANNVSAFVRDIQEFTENEQGFKPVIILVSPPKIENEISSSPFYGAFTESAIQ